MSITIDLSGTSALVTGAGAGIGAEIAGGWPGLDPRSPSPTFGRNTPSASSKPSAPRADGRTPSWPTAGRTSEMERMVDEAAAAFGGLDIAVNNIGMMAGRGGRAHRPPWTGSTGATSSTRTWC